MSSKKCLTRASHKSVKQELLNSVKQGCPTRVSPQCVNSGCLTNEFVGNVTNKYCLCLSTYVSAFGFVGFILFFFFSAVDFKTRFHIVCFNPGSPQYRDRSSFLNFPRCSFLQGPSSLDDNVPSIPKHLLHVWLICSIIQCNSVFVVGSGQQESSLTMQGPQPKRREITSSKRHFQCFFS